MKKYSLERMEDFEQTLTEHEVVVVRTALGPAEANGIGRMSKIPSIR